MSQLQDPVQRLLKMGEGASGWLHLMPCGQSHSVGSNVLLLSLEREGHSHVHPPKTGGGWERWPTSGGPPFSIDLGRSWRNQPRPTFSI